MNPVKDSIPGFAKIPAIPAIPSMLTKVAISVSFKVRVDRFRIGQDLFRL